MSKKSRSKNSNSFKILLWIFLICIVISVVLYFAYKIIQNSQENWVEIENKKIQASNEEMIKQHEIEVAEYQNLTSMSDSIDWPEAKTEGWDIVDLSNIPLENTNEMQVNRADALAAGLMLVNPWHPIPNDFELYANDQLVSIGKVSGATVAVDNYDLTLFLEAEKAIESFVRDAASEGLTDFIIRESFRSNDVQTALFNKGMEGLSSKYSGDILIEMTKKSINFPGTSEFQSGQSVIVALYNKNDPTVRETPFQETEQGKWLTENSWKYGFIFRFPVENFPDSSWEDKSHLTGVSIKLNVYRYVGIPHATIMHLMNFSLEEYIEYLIDHPHIALYQDGKLLYEIYRSNATNESIETVKVPVAASSFKTSLDNMGGLVATFTY